MSSPPDGITPGEPFATVLGLALRIGRAEAMREVDEATAVAGAGLAEEGRRVVAKRGLTLLSSGQWFDGVLPALGRELPWHARRANVLLSGHGIGAGQSLVALEGYTIRIGEAVRLHVSCETVPCRHIEELHPGLKKALVPEGRGGVCCRVEQGGAIAVGDDVVLLDEPWRAPERKW